MAPLRFTSRVVRSGSGGSVDGGPVGETKEPSSPTPALAMMVVRVWVREREREVRKKAH